MDQTIQLPIEYFGAAGILSLLLGSVLFLYRRRKREQSQYAIWKEKCKEDLRLDIKSLPTEWRNIFDHLDELRDKPVLCLFSFRRFCEQKMPTLSVPQANVIIKYVEANFSWGTKELSEIAAALVPHVQFSDKEYACFRKLDLPEKSPWWDIIKIVTQTGSVPVRISAFVRHCKQFALTQANTCHSPDHRGKFHLTVSQAEQLIDVVLTSSTTRYGGWSEERQLACALEPFMV